MQKRSSLSLIKLLYRYPFHQSPIPRSSIPLKPPQIPSRNHLFPNPTSNFPSLRHYSTEPSPGFDKNKIVDEINLKFAEAREEIESAMESKETVYFNEEAECARIAVKEVLDMFDGLLGKLDVKERDALKRSMGLKIEQLKAELQQLEDE